MYQSVKNRTRYGLTPDEEAFSRKSINAFLQRHFRDVSVSHFDFWHPSLGHTDEEGRLFQFLQLLEGVPLIRSLAGSLWIDAEK